MDKSGGGLWGALCEWVSGTTSGKRERDPVRLVSDDGYVLYRGQAGLFARKVDGDVEIRDETFLMDEVKDVAAVRFESMDGGHFLTARRGGGVALEPEPSEQALWEIEGHRSGGMRVRSKAHRKYLGFGKDGRVSATARKADSATPIKVIHALSWHTGRTRRKFVLCPVYESGHLSVSGGRVVMADQKRPVGERDILGLSYNLVTQLATFYVKSGAALQVQQNRELGLGKHGWFKIEGRGSVHAVRTARGYLSSSGSDNLRITDGTTPGPSNLFHLVVPPTTLADDADNGKVFISSRGASNGCRIVTSSVSVPTRPDLPFQAVKDWDNLYKFVDKIEKSRSLGPTPKDRRAKNAGDLVEMVQKHQFMFFRKLDTVVLESRENAQQRTLETRLRSSQMLRVYNCKWRAEADPADPFGSILHLEVEFSPSIPIPSFIIDGLVNNDTELTLLEIRKECIRRSAMG